MFFINGRNYTPTDKPENSCRNNVAFITVTKCVKKRICNIDILFRHISYILSVLFNFLLFNLLNNYPCQSSSKTAENKNSHQHCYYKENIKGFFIIFIRFIIASVESRILYLCFKVTAYKAGWVKKTFFKLHHYRHMVSVAQGIYSSSLNITTVKIDITIIAEAPYITVFISKGRSVCHFKGYSCIGGSGIHTGIYKAEIEAV